MSNTIDCPSCGAPINSGERACPYCGAAIKTQSTPVPPQIQLDRDLFSGNMGIDASTSDQFREIREQIRRGNKIEAIKLYREMTNVGLKEAKDVIDALAAGRPVVVSQSTVASAAAVAGAGAVGAVEIAQALQDHLRNGNKIEAIKVYRQMTGVSLAEAKAVVEAMESGQPVSFSQVVTTTTTGFANSAEAMDAIKAALRSGKKIEAIKIHRDYFDTGLADAKTAVEQIEVDMKFQGAPLVADTEPPAFAQPDASPVEPVISPNPFDEPRSPAWRKWLIGCSIGAIVFLCLCTLLVIVLGMAGIGGLGRLFGN